MSPAEALVPLFGIIFTFGIPGIIIFWHLYTRHRERMRLIEKGLSPDDVKAYFAGFNAKTPRSTDSYRALKFGIILFFAGIGIFIANLLEEKYNMPDGMTFGIVLLFIGLSFILYFLIVKNAFKTPQNNSNS
ncbi:hypothetical protein BH10BAC5_BH10BAC5_10000 [soil metagenome]